MPTLFSVPVPRTVVPSKNVTVPVGIFFPEFAFTVAVKVTDCPKTAGLTDAVTVLVVPIKTDWASAAEVLPVKLELPA